MHSSQTDQLMPLSTGSWIKHCTGQQTSIGLMHHMHCAADAKQPVMCSFRAQPVWGTIDWPRQQQLKGQVEKGAEERERATRLSLTAAVHRVGAGLPGLGK